MPREAVKRMKVARQLSPKRALWLFLFMVTVAFAQAVWWIVFMARLTAEKVDIAQQLGGTAEFIEQIHRQEVTRQIMVGTEGVFLLVMILAGSWVIYRALVQTEELTFHQQNFLMAVTHELKTPLASMKLYLDALQSTKIAPEKKAGIIPRMKEDVVRLEKMVENILDAGRFERSGYHLNKSTFNLSALVTGRLEAIQKVPTTVPLEVERTIQSDVLWYGDEVAFGRAIDAVLENGLKYHGGSKIQIATKLSADSKQIRIAIADHGIGFTAADAKAIFERFYRVGDEMTRAQSGTGLGLYLCREIIRGHGGQVAAASDGPGRGATFVITLKRDETHENNTAG